ncbi:MAG TPA: hypothetical protein VGC88_01040 [Terriglobales bacterium]|jgi:peroxiredoxin
MKRMALTLALAMPLAIAQQHAPSKAPDFQLQSADGQSYSLASQHGHKVLISFYKGYF